MRALFTKRFWPFWVFLGILLVITFAVTWSSLDAADAGQSPIGILVLGAVLAVLGAVILVANRVRITIRAEASAVIQRPIGEVFDALAESRNAPRWSPEVLSVEPDGPAELHATFKTRLQSPRGVIAATIKITGYEPPYLYSTEVQGSLVPVRGGYILGAPEPTSTLVRSWSECRVPILLAGRVRRRMAAMEADAVGRVRIWLETTPTAVP